MKSWWIFVINGETVATFAQTEEEAIEHLRLEYGDDTPGSCIDMIGLWMSYGIHLPRNTKICYAGMSLTDVMIASGILKAFAKIA